LTSSSNAAPILILTQGHAGDRLGARLVPALRERFPGRELVGMGGEGMAEAGVRILTRTDGISAIGWTGLLPQVLGIYFAIRRGAAATREPVPACVVAVDVWQPLRFLHKFGPHLKEVPHVCYLPPGPNFVGQARVHKAAAGLFRAIITPFPHQARLYGEAGARVVPAAHSGLQEYREKYPARPAAEREPILALLPGSRSLEVAHGVTAQFAAARRIGERYPELTPVVCCASEEVERAVRKLAPEARTSRDAREVLSRARFAIICSGTAALEAAVLGCPGVVTYHPSALQRWEWNTFHVPKLAKLRAAGTASPYISLPNIITGEELYPELLGVPDAVIAETALRELGGDLAAKRERLDAVTRMLSWEDAGRVVAEEVARVV
jgi:lipid-A-disaccharide synthase